MFNQLKEIMGWQYSYVVRIDLGPLLQGQTMVHWLWRVVFPKYTNLHCTGSPMH